MVWACGGRPCPDSDAIAFGRGTDDPPAGRCSGEEGQGWPGKGWLYESIYKKAEELGLRDVVFTGYIEEKDKPALIKGAKVFVLPDAVKIVNNLNI